MHIFFFIFHLFCFCVQCLLVGTFQQQTCSVLCRFIYFLFIYFGITSFVPCEFVQLIEKKKKKKKKFASALVPRNDRLDKEKSRSE